MNFQFGSQTSEVRLHFTSIFISNKTVYLVLYLIQVSDVSDISQMSEAHLNFTTILFYSSLTCLRSL